MKTKKIMSLLILCLLAFSLSGCVIIRGTGTTAEKAQKTYKQESTIDKESIIKDIYDDIYEQIESDLRESITGDLIKEFGSGEVSLDSLQEEIYKVVSTASKGNIGITTRVSNGKGDEVAYATGSAVIFDKTTSKGEMDPTDLEEGYNRYYFITNHHVIENGTSFLATFEDETAIDAYLIGSDETTDIACLYFDSKLTYVVNPLGDSDALKVGSIVLAIGNPKGETLYGSVTMGIIGGKNRNLLETASDGSQTRNTIVSYIQHDAAINSGNSGGGLYNLKGECVGINSVKYAASDIEGLNFSIPINLVKKVIQEIRLTGSYSGNVSLGISCTEVCALTKDGRTTYKVPAEVTSGVIVLLIDEAKSAYGILQEYDIIIKIDDTVIEDSSDIRFVLNDHVIGDTVSITVIRDGSETTVDLTFKRNAK